MASHLLASPALRLFPLLAGGCDEPLNQFGVPCMSPSVSIGVPVFNAAPFLSETLESVLAQTHGDFELIISDNASTDGTQDVIQAYAARDKRIRSFRQPVNIGLGNNWSYVARQARCPWFKWLSANDYCAPRLLEDSLAPLRADPAVVLCYGRTQLIDLAGQPLEVYAGDFDATSDDPLQRYRLVRERLHLGTPLQAGVIRLDALRRCGYLPNYRDCDRVLIAGFALIGKFVTLPRILFYRRWDASVASALRGPLETERLYRADAQRAPIFMNLPRQRGMLGIALRAPVGVRAKGRALAATFRYTDWRRKILGARAALTLHRPATDG